LGIDSVGGQFTLDDPQQVEQAFVTVETQDVADLGQQAGPLCGCSSQYGHVVNLDGGKGSG
jgi:hypothetical protein